jgi:hypothetical protein
MVEEYIELGPVPAGEECAQVGEPNFATDARAECVRYKEQLERMFPTDGKNNRFKIKSFPHDFGSYYEVCCTFDPADVASVDFAYNVEANLPEYWGD